MTATFRFVASDGTQFDIQGKPSLHAVSELFNLIHGEVFGGLGPMCACKNDFTDGTAMCQQCGMQQWFRARKRRNRVKDRIAKKSRKINR